MEKAQEVEAENGEGIEESKSLKDGSICGYESLHSLLSANLKPELFQVIKIFFSPLLFHLFFLGLSTGAKFSLYMYLGH
jgi:hypothetical protein